MVIEDLGAKLGKRVTNIHVVFRFSGKFDIRFSILIFSLLPAVICLFSMDLSESKKEINFENQFLRNLELVKDSNYA